MSFKDKLAAQRAKEALDKQLRKVVKDSAPSLNFAPRKEKEKEPPPPDLRELDIPAADRSKLARLIGMHSELTSDIGKLTKEKKELTEDIKSLCKVYELEKFMAAGVKSNYYKISRETISSELLLAQGVSHAVIARATVKTDSWAFRTGKGSGDEE